MLPLVAGTLLNGIFGAVGASKQKRAQAAALAAQQQAIAEAGAAIGKGYKQARAENQALYDKNNQSFSQYVPAADQALLAGYGDAEAAIRPMVSFGDAARDNYSDLIGLNGVDARDNAFAGVMDRPDYRAVMDDISRRHAAETGALGKGGPYQSGAAMRSLMDRRVAGSDRYVQQHLDNTGRLMSDGTQGRQTMAELAVRRGSDVAKQEWSKFDTRGQIDNAFHGNNAGSFKGEADARAGLAIQSGNAQAGYHSNDGQIDGSTWSGFGKLAGSLGTGLKGGTMSSFSNFFS